MSAVINLSVVALSRLLSASSYVLVLTTRTLRAAIEVHAAKAMLKQFCSEREASSSLHISCWQAVLIALSTQI
jgi:hypothetical protein